MSCWYCELSSDYHPTCDAPGCRNDTHGRGPEGKTVESYCDECIESDAIADGGDRYRCACGAAYRDRAAALRCCSQHAEGNQPIADAVEEST